MKYFLSILVLISLLTSGCRSVDCRMEEAVLSGAESRVMQNKYLRAEVVPLATGMLAGLQYRTTKKNLIQPFEYTVERMDLIPDRPVANAVGSRILLWGGKNLWCQEMKVIDQKNTPDSCELELFNKFYHTMPLNFKRKFRLEKDRAALQVEFTAKNVSKKAQTFTFWENMVAQLHDSTMDEVLLPGRGKIGKVGTRGVQLLPRDQIFVDDNDVFAKDVFIAPARGWLARRNPDSSVILAIRSKFDNVHPEGFFYTWKKQSGSPLHTMEIIFNPIVLEADEEKSYSLEYLVFNGLPNLHEICGNIGICATINENSLQLQFNSVVQHDEKELSVSLKDSNGKKIPLGQTVLQKLRPDKVQSISFAVPELSAGSYQIVGRFGEQDNFELLEPILVKQ